MDFMKNDLAQLMDELYQQVQHNFEVEQRQEIISRFKLMIREYHNMRRLITKGLKSFERDVYDEEIFKNLSDDIRDRTKETGFLKRGIMADSVTAQNFLDEALGLNNPAT